MFRPSKLIAAAVLVLSLQGCAYKKAITLAEDAVMEERWRDAVKGYELALAQKPGDPAAVAGLERSREPAVAEALDEARRLLAVDNWEDARAWCDYALGLIGGHPEATALRVSVGDDMAARLAALMDEGSWESAYGFLPRVKSLFPAASALPGHTKRLRNHFYALADGHLKAEAWEEALAAIDVVSRNDPDQANEVVARANEVRAAWAATVVEEAETFRKKRRHGAAAALYARAWEIGGSPAHLSAMQEQVARVRSLGQFRLDLTVLTSSEREPLVQDRLASDLGGRQGVVIGQGLGDPTLNVLVEAGKVPCTDTQVLRPASKRYVKEVVEVANPAYQALVVQLDDTEARLVALGRELPVAQRAYERALADLTRHESDVMQPIWGQLDLQRAAMTQLDGQIEGVRSEIRALEQDIAGRVATGEPEANITPLRQTVAQKRELEAQLLGERAGHEARVRDLERQEASVTGYYQGYQQRFATEESKYTALLAEQKALDAEAQRLRSAQAATAATELQNVMADFDYEITSWTRTCAVTMSVRQRRRYGDQGRDQQTYSSSCSTSDDSNPGYPEYGVAEDPAAYAESDAQLIAKCDAANVQSVLGALLLESTAFYAERLDEARSLMVSEPHEATDLWVALWVAAPLQVSSADGQRVREQLRQLYGLREADLLAR